MFKFARAYVFVGAKRLVLRGLQGWVEGFAAQSPLFSTQNFLLASAQIPQCAFEYVCVCVCLCVCVCVCVLVAV